MLRHFLRKGVCLAILVPRNVGVEKGKAMDPWIVGEASEQASTGGDSPSGGAFEEVAKLIIACSPGTGGVEDGWVDVEVWCNGLKTGHGLARAC